MTVSTIIDTLNRLPVATELWNDQHKIPWHEPDFSRRMLREHLTQDHDLASRKAEIIKEQVRWLHRRAMNGAPGHFLDLGCGPGLYSPHLAELGHRYRGIDFGPASIDYAQANFARKGQVSFRLGDVTRADYGGPHSLVCMLYGEFNVFSPASARQILDKAWNALLPGGRIVIEAHTFDAVKQSGEGRSWYATPKGLFSDQPHLCLTSNHWFSEQRVSRQDFHVLQAGGKISNTVYHSTMQAWTDEEYRSLLEETGFTNIALCGDWPETEGLQLLMAMK